MPPTIPVTNFVQKVFALKSFVAIRLSEAAGLALGLEEAEDVVLANGSLDVTDDRAGGVVDEIDADLGHASTGTCQHASQHEISNLSRSPLSLPFPYLQKHKQCMSGGWAN